jgi:hypothetical protein
VSYLIGLSPIKLNPRVCEERSKESSSCRHKLTKFCDIRPLMMKSFRNNFGIQSKVNMVNAQITKSLNREEQSHGLTKWDRTSWGNMESFGQNEVAFGVTDIDLYCRFLVKLNYFDVIL